MYGQISTLAFIGIEARPVEVQVRVTPGAAAFAIVGLPDKAVAESRERVRNALHAVGLGLPFKHITVNLAPADLPKEGSHFDLPIVLAMMSAMEAIAPDAIASYAAIGELALDGSIRAVPGTLPAAIGANTMGKGLICPHASGPEAAWASEDIDILAAPHLLSLVNHFKGMQTLSRPKPNILPSQAYLADLRDIKATPDRAAVGTVIEAKLDRGRGAVASVLVQNGTLRTGDSYIVGNTFGKIRAMFNDRGQPLVEAGPSTPVEILGLEGMPDAGDTFLVMADRDKAKGIAQYRKMKERESQLAKSSRASLEGLAEQIKQAGIKDLNLIVKGDVQGSVEVIAEDLQAMTTEKVRVRVLHSGVGAITESDVLLASASNAVIIGFNVRPERKAQELADQEKVEIRLHSIIYELRDEITKAMYGLLEPVFKENFAGRAEVLNVFKITKVGQIAGCRVTDGVITRNAQVRVLREGDEVWRGKIASLKRFKDDVSEVRQGTECGIDLGSFKDLRVGDLLETFTTEKLADELGQNVRKAAAAASASAQPAEANA